MSPTTAPNDGKPAAPEAAGVDPNSEGVRERSADMMAVVEKAPPATNPPLPFVVWPVPPRDLETL